MGFAAAIGEVLALYELQVTTSSRGLGSQVGTSFRRLGYKNVGQPCTGMALQPVGDQNMEMMIGACWGPRHRLFWLLADRGRPEAFTVNSSATLFEEWS